MKSIAEIEKGCKKYCYDRELKVDIICGQKIHKRDLNDFFPVWLCPSCQAQLLVLNEVIKEIRKWKKNKVIGDKEGIAFKECPEYLEEKISGIQHE